MMAKASTPPPTYDDMLAAGVDPVKVTRSALQNAASIVSGLFLTTEASLPTSRAEVCCPGRRCRHGLLIRKRSLAD